MKDLLFFYNKSDELIFIEKADSEIISDISEMIKDKLDIVKIKKAKLNNDKLASMYYDLYISKFIPKYNNIPDNVSSTDLPDLELEDYNIPGILGASVVSRSTSKLGLGAGVSTFIGAAALGSAIFPVIGTAIGAAIGAVIGGNLVFGHSLFSSLFDEDKESSEQKTKKGKI